MSVRQLRERDTEHNALDDSGIDDGDDEINNSQSIGNREWFLRIPNAIFLSVMHKSTRTGLIGIAVLIGAIAVIFLLNIVNIQSELEDNECFNLNGTATCYSKSTDSHRYYGTKTTYRTAIRKNASHFHQVTGCTPKVFYFFSRHAIRFPGENDIMRMIEHLPILREAILNSSLEGKANLCDEDINKFKVWKESMKPEDENHISSSGEREAESLAKRYKSRFPSILNKTYSPELFTFEYTGRERTRSTADFFAKGLFGKDVQFDEHINDAVLLFHKECNNIKAQCKDDSLDLYELKKFENGSVMRKVAQSISQRLGFTVNLDDVEMMYKSCAFGYALETDDTWCAVFSSDELQVLEYAADIDDYFKDSYGNAINIEQACPVTKFIVDLFKSSESITEEKAVFHFSHSGTIKKVYSMFGLFKDSKPLTADGTCSLRDRQWRSSLIAPFNSNIALVLHQCGNEKKIAAYVNEKAVVLDGCSSELCHLTDFYAKYAPIAENCDMNKICCTCCLQ